MRKISTAFAISMVFAFILAAFLVNGFLDKMQKVINLADKHQLATALEIYYYDNNSYPNISGGIELVGLLAEENYIRQPKIDGDFFNYEILDNGQNYKLTYK